MTKGYYMLFVKDVPKSTQIKWFVEIYSKGEYKKYDLLYIETSKNKIDSNKSYEGVYIRYDNEYRYIMSEHSPYYFKNFTEVFYCTDDINIGDL